MNALEHFPNGCAEYSLTGSNGKSSRHRGTPTFIHLLFTPKYLEPREGNKFLGFWEFLGLTRKFFKNPEI